MVPKTGATLQTRGMLYKKVVQLVLLYVSESWVMTGDMLKVPEGLHHRLARMIMGMIVRHMTSGECERPPVDEPLETAGLWPIKEYIHRRQEYVAAKLT